MATEPKTVKIRNVCPLGEVENWLARRTFAPGEVVELPAHIAGEAPSVRDYVEGEQLPAGYLFVDEHGAKKVVEPGSGLLGQPENFQLVVDEAPAPSRATKAPTA